MTGLAVRDALDADPVFADVPIIFATSHEPTTLPQLAARDAASLDSDEQP